MRWANASFADGGARASADEHSRAYESRETEWTDATHRPSNHLEHKPGAERHTSAFTGAGNSDADSSGRSGRSAVEWVCGGPD
jgi:hypothetical protein